MSITRDLLDRDGDGFAVTLADNGDADVTHVKRPDAGGPNELGTTAYLRDLAPKLADLLRQLHGQTVHLQARLRVTEEAYRAGQQALRAQHAAERESLEGEVRRLEGKLAHYTLESISGSPQVVGAGIRVHGTQFQPGPDLNITVPPMRMATIQPTLTASQSARVAALEHSRTILQNRDAAYVPDAEEILALASYIVTGVVPELLIDTENPGEDEPVPYLPTTN